jgi:hypothetical protein
VKKSTKPVSAESEEQRNLRHAKAFRDLEGRISDCVTTAGIGVQMITNARDVEGEVVFVVTHTSDMLTKLTADYYAAYHGERDMELLSAGTDRSESATGSDWLLMLQGSGADNEGAGLRSRAHTADKGLEPAASTRWAFLLLLSGPAICWLSLSGRWFRGATGSVGRENRAAHRRSHRL